MDIRKYLAEGIGTAILVILGVGVATLSFGFKMAGTSYAAGVVATALAFGLTLLALAFAIGPVSGAHVNPAVTIGFLLSGRLSVKDAVAYWISQIVGAIVGAAIIFAIFKGADGYSTDKIGLGTDGWGKNSAIGVNATGAFVAEVVLTFIFVFVVLEVTKRRQFAAIGGISIGFALAMVHLMGIAITGTSVNPARSIGPALFVGGDALSQLWLFIVAPLVGGAIAAAVSLGLFGGEEEEIEVIEVEA